MTDMPPAMVEVYYDSSCAPCKRELPELARAAEENLPFRIVILGDEAAARAELAEVSPALAERARGSGVTPPRSVLRKVGNTEGILPYARSLRANGSVCGQWQGVVSLERIRALLAACK